MPRPYTVEAEYMHPEVDGGHRTRAFALLSSALEYARWAKNNAIFRWALVRHNQRPIVLWDDGGEQYWNFKFIPKE